VCVCASSPTLLSRIASLTADSPPTSAFIIRFPIHAPHMEVGSSENIPADASAGSINSIGYVTLPPLKNVSLGILDGISMEMKLKQEDVWNEIATETIHTHMHDTNVKMEDAVIKQEEFRVKVEQSPTDTNPPLSVPLLIRHPSGGQKRKAVTDSVADPSLRSALAAFSSASMCPRVEPAEDNDCESITSIDEVGFAPSVHSADSDKIKAINDAVADAVTITNKSSKRSKLTRHWHSREGSMLLPNLFDPNRAVRIHGYDGSLEVRERPFTRHEYESLQKDELKWIVQYLVTRNQLYKMVLSAERFQQKFSQLRLDGWNHARRLKEVNPELVSEHSMTESQLSDWIGNMSGSDNSCVKFIYPSKPDRVELIDSADQCTSWLWTNRIDDCVVLVGLSSSLEKRAVLCHLSCQCNLDHLSCQLGQILHLYSSWCLLTNQVSPFAVRILVLLQRLLGQIASKSILVDGPSHILTQHGWPRRQKRISYHKQYFNPTHIPIDQLLPRTSSVVVDCKLQRLHIITDM
jgi:hypothetical protein